MRAMQKRLGKFYFNILTERKCAGCSEAIKYKVGETALSALGTQYTPFDSPPPPKPLHVLNFALGVFWHPSCFKCHECNRPIVESGFAKIDGEVLCPSCSNQLQESLNTASRSSTDLIKEYMAPPYPFEGLLFGERERERRYSSLLIRHFFPLTFPTVHRLSKRLRNRLLYSKESIDKELAQYIQNLQSLLATRTQSEQFQEVLRQLNGSHRQSLISQKYFVAPLLALVVRYHMELFRAHDQLC